MPSIQVVARFALRLVILLIFATLARTSFAGSMFALLWMSAVLCAVAGVMRREPPVSANLNHWDEMTSYIALSALAGHFALSAPS